MHPASQKTRGFTLIELLIVVAIIAILAAIAVPNLLEAQVRAKVSRADADMRSLATALESYRIDQNVYPPENWNGPELVPDGLSGTAIPNHLKLRGLTTPVAYISSLPADVFATMDDPLATVPPPTYHYAALNDLRDPNNPFFFGNNIESRYCQWVMQSNGPDIDPFPYQFPRYDPTNGTVSRGNILRFGP